MTDRIKTKLNTKQNQYLKVHTKGYMSEQKDCICKFLTKELIHVHNRCAHVRALS